MLSSITLGWYNGNMSESLKKYNAQFLYKDAQSNWLTQIRSQLTIGQIAQLCSFSERTIRDWQREKFLIDYESVVILCGYLSLPLPNIKKVDKYGHTSEAGKKGGRALIEKYGKVPVIEVDRQRAWRHWWETYGAKDNVKILQPKEIHTPKISKELAELIGIILGDGSITKYHVAVTLNSIDDFEYSRYVVSLFEKIFKVQPKVYVRKQIKALDIVVARVNLVTFLIERGLVPGHKVRNQVSIPKWIMENSDYARACVRGLVDTDGTFFRHRYFVKDKMYSYNKISFSSASMPLRNDVLAVLSATGIKAHCSTTNVRIDAVEDVKKYMKFIGSSNPKHLKKHRE